MSVGIDFLRSGGVECAPMSTTSSLRVALQYAASAAPLVFRLRTESFMERGADLAFLSAFPLEAELLYPPLTYLRPTGRWHRQVIGSATCTVIEIKVAYST